MLSRIIEFFRYYRVTTGRVFTTAEFPEYNYVSRLAFDNKLMEAWRIADSPILVIGPEDCGKTIFLKKHLLKLNEKLRWYHCTSQTTFWHIAYYLLSKSASPAEAERLITKMPLSEDDRPLFFLSQLAEIMGHAGINVVIENIQELKDKDQFLLGQLALYATSNNVRFIATATATSTKGLGFSTELSKKQLQVIYLTHLQNYQKHQLISMGEKALNLKMDKNLKHEIVLRSHTAQECQAHCYAICNGLGIKGRQKRLRHIKCSEGIIFLEHK